MSEAILFPKNILTKYRTLSDLTLNKTTSPLLNKHNYSNIETSGFTSPRSENNTSLLGLFTHSNSTCKNHNISKNNATDCTPSTHQHSKVYFFYNSSY